MNTTPTPNTYPTTQPLSLLTRDPLPEENPTPTETILEALIFASPQEQQHAHHFTQQLLQQFDHDQLPLTLPLQRHIRATTMLHINAIRAQNNTLPREDGKPTPGAITNAATNAITQQQRACDTFDQLLQRHKLQHHAELQARAEQQAREASQQEQDDPYHIHDTRIPICGYPLHLQPQKLQSLADALRRLDEYNQRFRNAGQPIHTIPYEPQQLFPTQNAPYPKETYPPDPNLPSTADVPSALPSPLPERTADVPSALPSPLPLRKRGTEGDLTSPDLPHHPDTILLQELQQHLNPDIDPTQEPQYDQDHPDDTPNDPTAPSTPLVPSAPSVPSVPSPPPPPTPNPQPRRRNPNLPPPRIATLKPGQRFRPV